MQGFRPQTYDDWLSEIKFSNTVEDIVNASAKAGKLNANKKAARHDIALVLADKYKAEMQRAHGRSMLTKTINKKFDKAANIMFKSKFSSLLDYVIKSEPSFDPKATNVSQGKTPLGFVNATNTLGDKGAIRTPLGFIKKFTRISEDGSVETGLGFLDDGSGGGALGFL